MGANDDLADRARVHAVDLMRFDARTRREVLKQLEQLEKDILDRLRASDIAGEDGVSTLTPFQRTRLETLRQSVTETIRTAYREIDRSTASELSDLSVSEGDWVVKNLNRMLGVETLTSVPTPSLLRAVASDAVIQGAPSQEWWSRQAGDLAQRFSDQIRQGMIAGETNSQIVRRIRGTRAAGYNDGIMGVTRRNAEALVRSSVQAVANEAQKTTARENSDVVKGYQALATLDSRTSDYCIARSGLAWDLDGNPIGHSLPFNGGAPWHWNCRTVMIPLLKSFRELGVNRDEIPPSTRSSLDGQVAEDLSFNDFLKGKSKTFQNDLLGEGKAQLWRDGKISLTDLLDQKGRPLTLEQLKERH